MKVYTLFAIVALFAMVLSGVRPPPPRRRPRPSRPRRLPSPSRRRPPKPPLRRPRWNRPKPLRPLRRPPVAPLGVFRSPMRTGCAVGTLWTTCGRRLDEAFLQGLAQVKWTADGVQPLLAESWDVEKDGKAFVFHLREGVKWHDGKPFTADDVVFSFNTFANPAVSSTYAAKLSDVLGYDEFKAGTANGTGRRDQG